MKLNKLKALMLSGLLTIGIVGSTSLDAYAATKTVKVSGSASINEFSMAATKTAYLYTYKSNGTFYKKYPITISGANTKSFKLGSTKIDDKIVSQVCVQVNGLEGMKNGQLGNTKYSKRLKLANGTYNISIKDGNVNVVIK